MGTDGRALGHELGEVGRHALNGLHPVVHVEDLTLAQLQEIMLTHTQGIPSFTQLLSAWPQDLPLLTEMKVDGRTDPAEMGRKTGALLEPIGNEHT